MPKEITRDFGFQKKNYDGPLVLRDEVLDDEFRSGGIHVTNVETNFIDTEYDESEYEDDYNTTLVGWCSKNNIRYLK